MNKKFLLNWHCYFGIASTIIAIVHVGFNNYGISFSSGYISLFSMILLSVTGIIMKYFKGFYLKNRSLWINTHILLTIVFVVSLLWHVLFYHFMY